MKYLLLTVFFIFFRTDSDSFSLIRTVKTDGGNLFLTDMLENIYIIRGQQIIKYNSEGLQESVYSNSSAGFISYADVSDPMRILLFYEEFNQVVFLNNALSELRSPVRLDDLGMEQVSLSCASKDGGFWVYNSETFQLVLFDKHLLRVSQSINLNTLYDQLDKPNFMIERNNMVYLNFFNTGILVFDYFSNYSATLPLKQVLSFQIADERIIYYQARALNSYNQSGGELHTLFLPDSTGVLQARIEQSRLVVFKEKEFSIYKINK